MVLGSAPNDKAEFDLAQKYITLSEPARAAFRRKIRNAYTVETDLPIVRWHDKTKPAPLSYAQERLWFLWRLEPFATTYVMSRSVRLDGALNVDALREAVSGLVRRHESLRTRFEDVDGTAWQVIEPEPVFGWSEHELAAITDHDAREVALREGLDRAAQTPFDLEKGP
ncbi:condensation domain-containing protein, partial [Agrobacterium tumefaciens]|uniref:condensation domain-containing protein n=1 Tax=Agrobacterium tumefaciens TaxID=358 RepID=UPI002244362F